MTLFGGLENVSFLYWKWSVSSVSQAVDFPFFLYFS